MSFASITKALFDPQDHENLKNQTKNQQVYTALQQKSSSRVGRFDSQKQQIILHTFKNEIDNKDLQTARDIQAKMAKIKRIQQNKADYKNKGNGTNKELSLTMDQKMSNLFPETNLAIPETNRKKYDHNQSSRILEPFSIKGASPVKDIMPANAQAIENNAISEKRREFRDPKSSTTKLNSVKISYKNQLGSATSTHQRKVDREILNQIHEKSASIKVSASFYDKNLTVQPKKTEIMEEIPDNEENESEKSGSEKKEKKRVNSVQPPKREIKKIGPLKIEQKYTGNKQSMFLSMSREQIHSIQNKHAINTPGFIKYRPNKDVVLSSVHRGIQMPTERKNTSQNFVKISENKGSLHPKYIDKKHRREPGYLSQLDRIDKIERNFNVDMYGNKNEQVIRKLNKNTSKEDVRLSKNFKVSIFKEVQILKELESQWRYNQNQQSSVMLDEGDENSNSAINLDFQSKQLDRGESARVLGNQSAMTALRSPSQGSLKEGLENDSSMNYQTLEPITSPSIGNSNSLSQRQLRKNSHQILKLSPSKKIVGNWNAHNFVDLHRQGSRKFEHQNLGHNPDGIKGSQMTLPNIYSRQRRVVGQVSLQKQSEIIRDDSKLFGKKIKTGAEYYDPNYKLVLSKEDKAYLFGTKEKSIKKRHQVQDLDNITILLNAHRKYNKF